MAALPPDNALVARLLYGTGMRLMEGLRLRVKDLDFDRSVIIVREAKGDKDRVVMLPRTLAADLRAQVRAARAQWEQDRHAQRGGVEVPHALEAKYPGVGQRWGWFWVLPSPTLSIDPRTGGERRRGFLARYPAGAILDEAQRCPTLFSYLQTRVDATQRTCPSIPHAGGPPPRKQACSRRDSGHRPEFNNSAAPPRADVPAWWLQTRRIPDTPVSARTTCPSPPAPRSHVRWQPSGRPCSPVS